PNTGGGGGASSLLAMSSQQTRSLKATLKSSSTNAPRKSKLKTKQAEQDDLKSFVKKFGEVHKLVTTPRGIRYFQLIKRGAMTFDDYHKGLLADKDTTEYVVSRFANGTTNTTWLRASRNTKRVWLVVGERGKKGGKKSIILVDPQAEEAG
ncbi:unnamed protein product, partial [Amoebophrya sp. A25]